MGCKYKIYDMDLLQLDYAQYGFIKKRLEKCFVSTDLRLPNKYQGKSSDTYEIDDTLLIISTDRQSLFDKVITSIPYKGVVISLLNRWWLEQTRKFTPNHYIKSASLNSIIVKKCRVIPLEIIVRGYISGCSSISLWTHYQRGSRNYCGLSFPNGLVKNQRLPEPVITPTTKGQYKDYPISESEIIKLGIVTNSEWNQICTIARALFSNGTTICSGKGLILVDAKYEFGRDENGEIVVVDEIHTLDTSRYWFIHEYEQCLREKKEPTALGKDILRSWVTTSVDGKIQPFQIPQGIRMNVSASYIGMYQFITKDKLDLKSLKL
jgi:phosphoribosylaminoimidazole-succinocarboxamide synthase